MRILIVTSSDAEQASGTHALWYAGELARRGHPTLVSLYGDRATAERARGQAPDGVEVMRHRFRGRLLDRASVHTATDFRPSLIHAWNPRVPTIVASRRYAGATGAPVFVHWEDDEWTLMKGVPGRPLLRVAGLNARKALARAFPSLGGAFSSSRTLAWIAGDAVGLDALTPALADEITRRIGRECAALLPVTPEHLAPVDAQASDLPAAGEDEAVVAYTGSVGPASVRDLEAALRAVTELQRRGRATVFVHTGPALPRYDLEQLARSAGTAPGTASFLGYVSLERMLGVLRRADVLVQPGPPSRFNRLRLPSKIQAYLASGTPTVMFAAGFGEMLVDREEVLKLHTEDPAELADRIAEILGDEALRRALSSGGPRASRRLFDPDTNIAALVEHYRRGLLQDGAGTRATR